MQKTLWEVFTGLEGDMPNWLGAILVYLISYVTCIVLQRLCRHILPVALYSYVADFFFTMCVCCYPYAHGSVRKYYGHAGYMMAAVPLATLNCLSFDGCGSPLGALGKFLRGMENLQRLVLRCVIMIAAAFTSYGLVYLVWSLEATPVHRQQLRENACQSDLRVPVMMGFLIEGLGVLYDTWLSQHQLFKNQVADTMAKIFNCCLMVCGDKHLNMSLLSIWLTAGISWVTRKVEATVVACTFLQSVRNAVHMTGGYFHPALASGMSWTCHGSSALEHILVYWIASFSGYSAGIYLYPVFHLPLSDGLEDSRREPGKLTENMVSNGSENDTFSSSSKKKSRPDRKED